MSDDIQNEDIEEPEKRERQIYADALGDLIRLHREKAGLSRTKLAEFTNISPNTMIKYEKAGIEGDGQFPTSLKLMKICEVLEIDPRQAFDCIAKYQFKQDNEPLAEGEIPWESPFSFSNFFRTESEWQDIRLKVTDAIELNDQYSVIEHRLDQHHEILRQIADSLKTNGPDHKDLSRPEKSTLEPEVAPTTPSNHPKDGGG